MKSSFRPMQGRRVHVEARRFDRHGVVAGAPERSGKAKVGTAKGAGKILVWRAPGAIPEPPGRLSAVTVFETPPESGEG